MDGTFMAIYLPNLLDHVQLESITSLKGVDLMQSANLKKGSILKQDTPAKTFVFETILAWIQNGGLVAYLNLWFYAGVIPLHLIPFFGSPEDFRNLVSGI